MAQVIPDVHVYFPELPTPPALAPELATARLLVIGTYRDGELPPDHPLRHTLGKVACQPGSDSLPLHGLSAAAVAQCMEHTLGVTPTAAVLNAVYQRTEGNPFFLTEVMRLLGNEAARAALHSAQAAMALPVPQRVRDVVTRRLQTLSVDCQHLLAMTAIIGREFRLPVLEAVKAGA
jgi:predicted ATPase